MNTDAERFGNDTRFLDPSHTEEWRPITWAPGYEVSSHGRVRSLPRTVMRRGHSLTIPGKILNTDRSTYPRASLRTGGVTVYKEVHVLVAEFFIGARDAKARDVRHLDDDSRNNGTWNIAYGTRSQNIADAKRNKKFLPKFERSSWARREDAVAIASSTDAPPALAARFGISIDVVYAIQAGRSMREVTEGYRIWEGIDRRTCRQGPRRHPSLAVNPELVAGSAANAAPVTKHDAN